MEEIGYLGPMQISGLGVLIKLITVLGIFIMEYINVMQMKGMCGEADWQLFALPKGCTGPSELVIE